MFYTTFKFKGQQLTHTNIAIISTHTNLLSMSNFPFARRYNKNLQNLSRIGLRHSEQNYCRVKSIIFEMWLAPAHTASNDKLSSR